MKRIRLFILPFFFSCSGSSGYEEQDSDDILDNSSYTIDTVRIDSREGILALRDNSIGIWTLSQDFSKLYIFSEKLSSVQEIDLDERRLTAAYLFEKEGPNGIGGRVMDIYELKNGEFVFSKYSGTGVFAKTGEKIIEYRLKSADIEGIQLDDDFPINHHAKISSDGEFLYAIHEARDSTELMVIDLSAMRGDALQMPHLTKTRVFNTMLLSQRKFYAQNNRLQFLNNQVIGYSAVTQEIYIYNPQLNQLEHKTFPHRQIPLEKNWAFKHEASSQQEFNDIMEAVEAQIEFGRFHWDEDRKYYYRLSQKAQDREYLGKEKRYDTFFHVFDGNLLLIGEFRLEKISQKLTDYFFKDGKLYAYVNVDDELGFAVIDFNINP